MNIEDYKENIYTKGYENGCQDILEALRYIQKMKKSECFKAFGLEHGENIIDKFNAEEIFKKLYNYKNKIKIKVGDEIKLNCGNGIVTQIIDENSLTWINEIGETGVIHGVSSIDKTGRTFPIQDIFDCMKIDSNKRYLDIGCEKCKYVDKREFELPCSLCEYNSESDISYFEPIEEANE